MKAHQATEIVAAAIRTVECRDGQDKDAMLMPVELVAVDDAVWVRVANFAHGGSDWVVVWDNRGRGFTGRFATEDDVAETDLDEWRI